MEYRSATIRNISVYPIKSVRRIDVRSAFLTQGGLVCGLYKDHEFMVVSNDPEFIRTNKKSKNPQDGVYRFVTQRDHTGRKNGSLSVMALIRPEFNGDRLSVTWNYTDPMEIPPDMDSGIMIPVGVWDYEGHAIDQGDIPAEWLSDHLGINARLVKAGKSFGRMAKQTYMRSDSHVYFHDAYPVHWFPIESVQELSDKTGEDIPWQSFRPQIVAEGIPPRYEHEIFVGIVSGIPFIQPKPCDRCPVTLIDQETGQRRPKKFDEETGKLVANPLFTLSKYKNWVDRHGDVKQIFGENMNPLGSGKINIGDSIETVSHRDPPLVYGP